MIREVRMPKTGLTVQTGVIDKWFKKEGEYVKKGEPLFEVTTDKVTVEIEAQESGYLKKILVKEGIEIPIREIIAYIGDKDD